MSNRVRQSNETIKSNRSGRCLESKQVRPTKYSKSARDLVLFSASVR